jgi:predicted NUDIX family NTP pyrophosphohydrolase
VPTPRESAGILLYRRGSGGELEVLLVHMGGPFWARREAGAWTLPKGEIEGEQAPLETALREFAEETGQRPPDGEPIELGAIRQSGGKTVHGCALCGDFDVTVLKSNVFTIEWPRGSGRTAEFPEVDRAGWFDLAAASRLMVKGQSELLDRLAERLS